jgi:membrane protein implicated in regulation of membrane protease activity
MAAVRCPTCGRHVDRCPTCGQPVGDFRGELVLIGFLFLMCAVPWLVFAVGHPIAALHQMAGLTPFGLLAFVPLALLVVVWWGGWVYARPGDERPRPKRRSESTDGSE